MSGIILTRRESFSASHRLHAATLSDAENVALFGRCNHIHGHGHNYVLEVSLKGSVDPKTGLLFNLADLKSIMADCVLRRVDHKHLNLDVPEFQDLNPTTENLAIVIWKWLSEKIPRSLLYEIKIFETEKNSVIYRGDAP